MRGQAPNLVLIGMPASGKSTVGRALSRRMNMPFVDTDDLLEQHVGLGVQELVERRGLNNFRKAEQATIQRLELQSHIISTGGSVVYSEQAMQHLATNGTVVFLKVSLRTVQKRIARAMDRGLVKYPAETLPGLYYQRAPLYRRWADVTLNNDRPLTDLRLHQFMQQIERHTPALNHG